MMICRILFGILTVILVACFAADGQQTNRPDFASLKNKRIQTIAAIDNLRNKIRQLENDIEGLPSPSEIESDYLQPAQEDITNLQDRLDKARKETQPDEESIGRIETDLQKRKKDLAKYQRDMARKSKIEKDIEQDRNLLKQHEEQLFNIEGQINDLLAVDVVAQNFKSQISLYFAVLVGFMILCFFGIAFYDPGVRVTIFSGQAGMQFVTLFSLIIAIILFGITGILEDKELAALLGGLSGYILGRYASSEQVGRDSRNTP